MYIIQVTIVASIMAECKVNAPMSINISPVGILQHECKQIFFKKRQIG